MRGEFLENVIACGMAVRVVDLFEVIQVQREHGKRMALALRPRDFGGEAMLGEATIVEAGQRIDHRQRAEDFRVTLFFSELAAQTLDEDFLRNGVDIENKDETDQAEDGFGEFDIENGFGALAHGGESEDDDGKGEKKNDENRIAPDAPIVFFDLAKLAGEVLLAGARSRRLGLGVGHTHTERDQKSIQAKLVGRRVGVKGE